MIPFLDVVNNWGDFGRRVQNPLKESFLRGGGHPFVGLDSQRAEAFQRYVGANAYTDSEPGFGAAGRVRERYQQGWGRRLYEARLAEVAKITREVFTTRGGLERFREAMSISDFPNIFGDVIDRAVLANYLETPYTWNLIANAAEVSDFRPIKRFRIDGGTGLLSAIQPTGAPNPGQLTPLDMGAQYPEDFVTDNAKGFYTYSLFKQGKRMPFFWETFVNDDLNAIKDTPARFGRGARRTEEFFVTSLFANNSTFYSNANKNIVNTVNVGGIPAVGNNPALTITALQAAIIVMMQQVDTTNQPISVEAMTLVVPPSLKTIAMNILNTDYVWMADQGGTTNVYGSNTAAMLGQMLHAQNWAKNIVRLAVNYYLPIVDTTHGQSGWYLFANPENGRPALEFGRLRGHIQPELFMKLPNSVAIGEGTMGPGPGTIPGTTNMNPMEGDFDTDAVHYKVRHVIGGTLIDPIMSVYSNGSGM